MSCYLCENNAIGLCRGCYKFYCHVHGDGFCSACQAKGWRTEQGQFQAAVGSSSWSSTKRFSSAAMAVDATAAPSSSTESAERREEAATTPQTASESKAEEAKPEKTTQTFMRSDHERLEDPISPTTYVGLLPVFGSCKVNDVLLLLKGIELYREACGLDLLWRFTPDIEELGTPRHFGSAEITLHDDVGTVYQLHQRHGSGSIDTQTQFYAVTPALHPDAGELTLEVPRLQFHGPMMSRHPRRSTLSYLVGPWKITAKVPARDNMV